MLVHSTWPCRTRQMETPLIRTHENLQTMMVSPLPPMEALDLAEFDLIDLQAVSSATTIQDEKLKTTITTETSPSSTTSSDSSLPKPEDGFRFSDLDLVSEARTILHLSSVCGCVSSLSLFSISELPSSEIFVEMIKPVSTR